MKTQQPFLITLDTIQTFLKRYAKKRLPFTIIAIIERDEVSKYSNANYLWRVVVRTAHGREVLFVKQARGYNKRAWEKDRQKLIVDPLRIRGEYRMLTFLQKLWGKGSVPDVYFFDPRHHVLIMSDVSRDGRLLVEEFARDRIHPELGSTFGRMFGTLHATTYRSRRDCAGSPEWRARIIDAFGVSHFGHGIRKFVPHATIDAFYRAVARAPHAWIWADPVYRNIFVKPRGKVSMVDFDFSLRYDPAFDCGEFLAQWVWMGLKSQKLKVHSQKFIGDFWRAYTAEFAKRRLEKEIPAIRGRALRWMGQYLVSRTDGRSGSYFAKWPAWEKRIRAEGIALFLNKKTPSGVR